MSNHEIKIFLQHSSVPPPQTAPPGRGEGVAQPRPRVAQAGLRGREPLRAWPSSTRRRPRWSSEAAPTSPRTTPCWCWRRSWTTPSCSTRVRIYTMRFAHRQLKNRWYKHLPELPSARRTFQATAVFRLTPAKIYGQNNGCARIVFSHPWCSSAVLRIVRHNNKSLKRLFL